MVLRLKLCRSMCTSQKPIQEQAGNRGDKIKKSREFWFSITNQRNYFDQIAQKYDVKSPNDWNKLSYRKIAREGGQSILRQYSSLSAALETVYPEYDWKSIKIRSRVVNKYWNNIENQRKFFDEFAARHNININRVDDWSNVTYQQVSQEGGKSILQQYSSLLATLEALYPENDWKSCIRTRAPNNYWQSIENQRKFFDDFAKKQKICQPSDWSKVNYKKVVQEGGQSILNQYPSLLAALETIYPELEWGIYSQRVIIPQNYWNDIANVKEFIEKLRDSYHIQQDEDWYRISIKQIQQAGGTALIAKYNSLCDILKAVYPDKKWDKKNFQRRHKRSAQRWMFLQVQKAFPDCEVVEEYLHEELSRKSGRAIELDVFVPARQIAFEYQGEHHFHDSPALGSGFIELHQQRDTEKLELCKGQGITLVVVPYWWDNSLESLQGLINTATNE